MKMFNKKSDLPDIDRLLHKRKYMKLIEMLTYENLEIVERTKKALNDLAVDEEAIGERKATWGVGGSKIRKNVYGHILQKLNSDKLASIKNSLQPLMQKLEEERDSIIQEEKKEKDNIEEIEKIFEKFKLTTPSTVFIKDLLNGIDTDEEIEYVEKIGPGEHWMSTQNGILLTNNRIIFFDEGVRTKLKSMDYKKIVKIKKGFAFTKFLNKEGRCILKFTFDHKELISRIEDKLSIAS